MTVLADLLRWRQEATHPRVTRAAITTTAVCSISVLPGVTVKHIQFINGMARSTLRNRCSINASIRVPNKRISTPGKRLYRPCGFSGFRLRLHRQVKIVEPLPPTSSSNELLARFAKGQECASVPDGCRHVPMAAVAEKTRIRLEERRYHTLRGSKSGRR
jgi:hypothetical protein